MRFYEMYFVRNDEIKMLNQQWGGRRLLIDEIIVT